MGAGRQACLPRFLDGHRGDELQYVVIVFDKAV
jgi:hypothetical protein